MDLSVISLIDLSSDPARGNWRADKAKLPHYEWPDEIEHFYDPIDVSTLPKDEQESKEQENA